MKIRLIDENGVSYIRAAEFGFCWVEESALEKYRKEQSEMFAERLKRRNDSRRRRGVHVVSVREAKKRAARYRESLRLDMNFKDYLKYRMYLSDDRYLAMKLTNAF